MTEEVNRYVPNRREIIGVAARSALHLDHPSDLRSTHALVLKLEWNRMQTGAKRFFLRDARVQVLEKEWKFEEFSPESSEYPLVVETWEIGQASNWSTDMWLPFDPLAPL